MKIFFFAQLGLKTYQDQTFGSENEYTYHSLIGGVESLLTDISTLTKYENKFLKLTTYQNRSNVLNHLSNINSYLDNPSYLYQYVDQLKEALRSYNIRSFSENQIEFEKEVDNIRILKQEIQQILQDSQKTKEEIASKENEIDGFNESSENTLSQIKDRFEQAEDKLIEIEKRTDTLSTLNSEMEEIKTNSEKSLAEITEIKTDSESNKKIIDLFANKIQDRESRLDLLEQKTEQNTKNLSEYESERSKILEEAKKLIKNSKQALNYTTAQGLSASFNTQYNNSKKWWLLAPWIAGAIICLGGALYGGYWIIENINSNDNEWYLMLSRILLLPLPIAGAIFCANQYTKQKNIIEDYAYKTTLSKAIVGFSEQLKKNGTKDNTEYVNYIQKALEEIHKDPLRSRNEKGGTPNLKKGQYEQIISFAEKIIAVSQKLPKN